MGTGRTVSIQIVEGVDKGRCFLGIPTPVTIGREEGNVIRLNDDRVSRFHAKIMEDHGEIVLTDLDSTNGTRVNGETVQLRILRIGDRINVGRSTLLLGTLTEIKAQLRQLKGEGSDSPTEMGDQDVHEDQTSLGAEESFHFGSEGPVDVFTVEPPPLPTRLSPAQAAQLSELVDFLHRGLADAIGNVRIPPGSPEAHLEMSDWQKVQAILAILAQYARGIAEPGSANDD